MAIYAQLRRTFRLDLRHTYLIPLLFIAVLFSCGTGTSNKNGGAEGLKSIDFEEVKATYGYKCSMCHGREGVSVIRNAPDLVYNQQNIEERMEIISNGLNTMPPQKDVLEIEMIRGLAMYIDSLAN